MKVCPNCGAQLQDTAAFCNSCGTAIAAAPAAPQYAAPAAPQYAAPAAPQYAAPAAPQYAAPAAPQAAPQYAAPAAPQAAPTMPMQNAYATAVPGAKKPLSIIAIILAALNFLVIIFQFIPAVKVSMDYFDISETCSLLECCEDVEMIFFMIIVILVALAAGALSIIKIVASDLIKIDLYEFVSIGSGAVALISWIIICIASESYYEGYLNYGPSFLGFIYILMTLALIAVPVLKIVKVIKID